MQSFVKIKSTRYGEITFSFTDLSKSCPSHESFTPQIRLLTLFAKIKNSRKFPILLYIPAPPLDEVSYEDEVPVEDPPPVEEEAPPLLPPDP